MIFGHLLLFMVVLSACWLVVLVVNGFADWLERKARQLLKESDQADEKLSRQLNPPRPGAAQPKEESETKTSK